MKTSHRNATFHQFALSLNSIRKTQCLSKALCFFCVLTVFSVAAVAQEFANIEYLCADWGPAVKLPAKEGEKAIFSDAEEEVYFLKQVGWLTRGITGEQGKGINIYLCKMKSDGSGKTEIKELWDDVRYPIDTQAQSSWMDVNGKTKKIALSITYAGSDLTGLWTVNLDGSELRRIITPEKTEKGLEAIDNPSWTMDGQSIVYQESVRGTNYSRIAKSDKQGGNRVYLTDGPVDSQPRVSPGGKQIAYIHWIQKGKANDSWLWLIGVDGSNTHPFPNPQARPNWSAQAHWGTYPAWSPDGKKILTIGVGIEILDAATGCRILQREPVLRGKRGTCGMAHWGKLGLVGITAGGILFTDSDLQEAKWIGSSKLVECRGSIEPCQW